MHATMFDVRRLSLLFIGGFAWAHIPVPQPVFRSGPTNVKHYENDSIFLPCTVDNLGENVLRWWKNDVLLADTSDPALIAPPRIKMWHNKSLQIDDLEPGDSGEYRCQIVRPDPWSPLQQTHTVQVLYPPQVFPIPASGYIEVGLGGEVEIGCRATGSPAPLVTWRSKGELMQLIDNRHKLKFTAESRLMSGIYQCEADNKVGEPVHANIRLRVVFKPEVTADRPWIHSSPGVRAELVCRVQADPEAMVEWYFNGSRLTPESSRVVSHVHGDGHILLFRNVRASDFGQYICQAYNTEGNGEAVIHLSGVANPAVFKKDNTKPAPDSYTLIWEVDSYSPIIEYNLLFREKFSGDNEWVKLIIPADGHSPGPLHSKSYTLTGLTRSTVYQAKLLSRNRYGWSNPSNTISFATEGTEIEHNDLDPEPEEQESDDPVQSNAILRRLTGRGNSHHSKNVIVVTCLTVLAVLRPCQ